MPPTRPARLQLLTEVLAWIARGLILGLLFVAPWPYAMAKWSSQVWLIPVVGAILLLASLVALSRRQSVGNPLVWSLSAVLAIGLLQVAPLPEPLWKLVAPLAGFEQQVAQLTNEFKESAGASRLAAISESTTDDVQQEEAENTDLQAKDSDGTDEAVVSQEASGQEGSGQEGSAAEMQSDAERRATFGRTDGKPRGKWGCVGSRRGASGHIGHFGGCCGKPDAEYRPAANASDSVRVRNGTGDAPVEYHSVSGSTERQPVARHIDAQRIGHRRLGNIPSGDGG